MEKIEQNMSMKKYTYQKSLQIMQIINNDLIDYIIQNFLNPMALFSLRQVAQYFKNRINRSSVYNSVIRNMDYILTNILGDNVLEFKQLIKTYNAVISGSFITQCVIDEYWENSDIDIFILSTRKGLDYKDFEKFLCGKMNFSKTPYDPFYLHNYTAIKEICTMVSYEINHYSFHIMWVSLKDRDLIKFLWTMCDFDICRNIYHINNNKEILNICAVNDICNKTTKFKLGQNGEGSTMRRYEKYTKRGFNIICDLKYDDFITSAGKFVYEVDDEYNWGRISYDIKNEDPANIYYFYEIFKIKQMNEPSRYKSKNKTYKLIEGDVNKLSKSYHWNHTIFLENDILIILQQSDWPNFCSRDFTYCPLIFCGSKLQHIHFRGVSLGENYSDFIFIIVN